MACLTAEQLELLVREALEPDVARALRAHLAQCPACRAKLEECQAHEKLADKLRAMGAAAELESPGEPESGRTTTVVDDSRTLGPSAVTYTTTTAAGAASGSTVALPACDAFPGYEVLGEISRGGQGVVYRAYQLGTKREVAISPCGNGDDILRCGNSAGGHVRPQRVVRTS